MGLYAEASLEFDWQQIQAHAPQYSELVVLADDCIYSRQMYRDLFNRLLHQHGRAVGRWHVFDVSDSFAVGLESGSRSTSSWMDRQYDEDVEWCLDVCVTYLEELHATLLSWAWDLAFTVVFVDIRYSSRLKYLWAFHASNANDLLGLDLDPEDGIVRLAIPCL